MITENLSTLKIHKLTQAQYDRELETGRIDENALYLTPDEEIDAVRKSGDTMTGYLNFEKSSNNVQYKTSVGVSNNGNTYIPHYTDGTLDNYISLGANGSFASKPWSIESGGTGATTAAAALTNLGLTATAAELNKMDGVTATTAELNYVDGVTSNIQTQLDGKAPTSHASSATTYGVSNASNYGHSKASATTPKANGTAAVGSETSSFARGDHVHPMQVSMHGITTGGTGAAYTATVDGITALTAGVSFIMIPNVVSTSTAPTLNVNSLGAKAIRRMVSNSTTSTSAGYNDSWLAAGKPIRVAYNGTYWIADLTKPSAADVSGTLKVANGGTGATSLTAGSYLVGNGTSAVSLKTPAEVLADIGAAPTGYGLGERAFNAPENDANQITKCGFFRAYVNTPTDDWWTIQQEDLYGDGKYMIQKASCYAYTHVLHAERMVINGSFYEWEWVNPPMTVGVEYRTTERWNGHVVYMKLVSCGLLPNANNKSVDWGAQGSCFPIRWSGAAQVSNSQDYRGLPYDYVDNSIRVGVTNWQIYLTTTSDYSTQEAYVQVWYTK